MSMEKLIASISAREEARLTAGRKAWEKTHRIFEKMGVSAELFGSMARGDAGEASDIDVLVLNRNEHSRGCIMDIIEESAENIPVDVVFAEDTPRKKVERMLNEAKL